ncbi:hypothetical protein AVEN_239790-1 [Araneus ventricosus]|uniref:Uncharacterized protein n=1 Tax=Araneus ventricosus TaxID=182803 RepID=A0A4Y2EVT0_ARAVE|nr:hypothetical protein AVEN_239790-1 [Araneus ventricosus]
MDTLYIDSENTPTQTTSEKILSCFCESNALRVSITVAHPISFINHTMGRRIRALKFLARMRLQTASPRALKFVKTVLAAEPQSIHRVNTVAQNLTLGVWCKQSNTQDNGE